jgi:hypothetical protein
VLKIIVKLKKMFMQKLKAVAASILFFLSLSITGQNCIQSTQSPSGSTLTVSDNVQTMVGLNIPSGTYSSLNFTAAGQYAIAASISTYFTLTDNANTPIISGYNTLIVNITTPGLYHVHVSTDNACSTAGGTRIVTINPTNRALNFVATSPGDNVVLPSALTTSLSGLNKITVEAWVRTTSTLNLGCVIGNYTTPSNQMQFLIRRSGANYQFWIGNSNGTNYLHVNSSITTTIGVWQHVAGVWNGTVSSIYIDGVLSGTAAVSYTSLGNATNSIVIGGNGIAENFQGDIDEVRIWNRALCQSEIQNNMTGEIATTGNGLIANYHFNHGIPSSANTTYTTLTDYSGNSYNGSLLGVALTGATSNWVAPGAYTAAVNAPAFVSPVISVAGTNSICAGQSATLTASGNVSTYTWTSGPSTASLAVNPLVTTTYSVIGTNSSGCLSNMATKTISVTSNPTVTVNNGTICSGNSFSIIPGGASTYTIQGGSTNVSPLTTTGFTVVGTATNGCVSANTATSTVTVNGLPTITANSGTINSGSTFTISPSGGVSYTYAPSGPTVNPSSTSVYTITGSNANGCVSSNVSTVSVNGAALNFLATNPGDNVVLPAAITNSLTGTNKITVEAWVRPTSLSGLHNIVGNYRLPANEMQFLIRASPSNFQLWIGNSTSSYSFTASLATPTLNIWQHIAGAWDGTVASIYVNGALSATASITYTSFATTTNSLVIGGNALNENFNGDIDEVRIWNRALCQGEIQNNMLGEIPTTGNGLLANYHFNQGISAINNSTVATLIDASGNANTGTLTGLALTGSTSNWIAPGAIITGTTAAAFVSPTIAISGATLICSGNATTYTASGNVSSYVWTSGPSTATYSINPTATTTYSVIGTNSLGCVSNMATRTLSVNTTPTVAVNNGTICSGNSFSIVPTGANTYTIQGGNANVSPTSTSAYTVVGTAANGCISANTATSNLTVNATPTITANDGLICTGQSFTIMASGAITYTYSSNSNVVSPLITTAYSVTGTSSLGCVASNTAISNVTVVTTPTVTVNSGVICSGETFTIIPSGATSYTFSNGSSTVSPTSNSSYSVSAAAAICSVTVNLLPTISVNDGTICAGDSFTIIPSGANTYTVSGGNLVVTPSSNSSYSVTGTSTDGCVGASAAVSSVTVNALPTVAIVSSSSLLCEGETTSLTTSGALTYTWNSNQTTTVIAISPTTTTTYSLTGTDGNGCSNITAITQSVSNCTGINSLVSKNQLALSVYPNPSKGLISVELANLNGGLTTISLINTLGQVMLTETTDAEKAMLNISKYTTGVYILKIENKGFTKTVRLIKE